MGVLGWIWGVLRLPLQQRETVGLCCRVRLQDGCGSSTTCCQISQVTHSHSSIVRWQIAHSHSSARWHSAHSHSSTFRCQITHSHSSIVRWHSAHSHSSACWHSMHSHSSAHWHSTHSSSSSSSRSHVAPPRVRRALARHRQAAAATAGPAATAPAAPWSCTPAAAAAATQRSTCCARELCLQGAAVGVRKCVEVWSSTQQQTVVQAPQKTQPPVPKGHAQGTAYPTASAARQL